MQVSRVLGENVEKAFRKARASLVILLQLFMILNFKRSQAAQLFELFYRHYINPN